MKSTVLSHRAGSGSTLKCGADIVSNLCPFGLSKKRAVILLRAGCFFQHFLQSIRPWKTTVDRKRLIWDCLLQRNAAFELLPVRFLQCTASAATSQWLPTELREGHNRGQSRMQESSLWKGAEGCQQSLSQPTGRVTDLHLSCSSPFSMGTTGSFSPIQPVNWLLFEGLPCFNLPWPTQMKVLGWGRWQHCHCKLFPAGRAAAYHKACKEKSSWMKGSLFKHNQNSPALAGSPGPFWLPASGRASHLLGTSHIWKYTDLMSKVNLLVFHP